jgi:hypothetical protein
MTALSTAMLQIAFAVVFVVCLSYVAGRVHQWYRHSMEREVAYRDGYDEASHSLFRLATRSVPPGESSRRIVRELAGSVHDSVQSAVSKANREASTYRLTPRRDAVASGPAPQTADAGPLR